MRLCDRIYLVGSGEIGLSDSWDCHVYAIDGGATIALVDAGGGRPGSLEAIEANMRRDGLDPGRIGHVLLTHSHLDHAGGTRRLRDRYRARVAAPQPEQGYIESGRGGVTPCPVDLPLGERETLEVGSLRVAAIRVPGHSEATTCFLLDHGEGRALFAADVLFFNGVLGLINHPGSSLDAYRESIGRLAGLAVDQLLPAHMLFALRGGQRHVDRAVEALRGGFVPISIGQPGTFVPPDDY